MNAAITIRTATLEDIPMLLHQRRGMFLAMGCTDSALQSVESLARRYFREAIENGTFHGWMAVDPAGNVVGGGGVAAVTLPASPFSPTTTRPEIINIFVEPEFRRQGIARRLMEVMVEWCIAQGYAVIYLHASDEGRPLYTSMGFTPTTEMQLHVK